jgi:exopolysaccharide production protein ExoY
MLGTRSVSSALLRALDLGAIVIGFAVARDVVIQLRKERLFIGPVEKDQYLALLLLGVLAWIGVSSYQQIYRSHRVERLSATVEGCLRTLLLWGIAIMGGIYLLKLHDVSRQFTIYFVAVSGTLIVLRQCIAMSIARRLRLFGYDFRTALVIGDGMSCRRFGSLLAGSHPMGYRLVFASTGSSDIAGTEGRQLSIRNLPEADEAFVIAGGEDGNEAERAALELLKRGIPVHMVPGLLDAGLFRQTLGDVAGVPVVSLESGQLSKPQAFAKRLVDVVGAAVVLIVTAPLLIVVAALVKLSSPGPVLFAQKRLGKAGKPFRLYKFRSMRPDAEEVLKKTPGLYEQYVVNNFKLPEGKDPRITALGAILRATSLDELPQLFNVLKGDMSLVGPRPIVPPEIEKYGEYSTLFMSVKPGMTGHWQVNGRSAVEEYAKRVKLDLEYVRDQGVGKDLEILLRTVPAVIRRKGAY